MTPVHRRLFVVAKTTALVGAVWSAGCGVIGDDAVELRFRNASAVDLTDFTYQSASEPLHFDLIPAGSTTEYREISASYRYGFVEAFVDTTRLVLQPIDYVGESRLAGGRYTFVLTVDLAGPYLGLELQPD